MIQDKQSAMEKAGARGATKAIKYHGKALEMLGGGDKLASITPRVSPNQTNKQVEKAIIDLIWYTLMYSPDGDNERQQYWLATKEGLEKDVDKIIKQTKLDLLNDLLTYADKHELEEVRQTVKIFKEKI